jgi:hypothetical protein
MLGLDLLLAPFVEYGKIYLVLCSNARKRQDYRSTIMVSRSPSIILWVRPTNCAGKCVNIETDILNCGSCGTNCNMYGYDLSCKMGICTCPQEKTLCHGSCVDTLTEKGDCGTCGNFCQNGKTCSAGTCKCPSGQTDCYGVCTNLQSDNNNCGSCEVPCQSETIAQVEPVYQIIPLSDPHTCQEHVWRQRHLAVINVSTSIQTTTTVGHVIKNVPLTSIVITGFAKISSMILVL